MATTPTRFNEERQANTTDAPPPTNDSFSSDQSEGHIASLPDGGYLVVWTDRSGTYNPGGFAILGQRYDALGERVGVEFRVSQFDDGELMVNPAVTALAGGGVAVAFGAPGEGDIYVQRYDANLNFLGIDTIDTTVATDASLAPLPDGGYVVSYTLFGPDRFEQDDDQVMARIVSPAGVVGAPFAIHDGGLGSYEAELAVLPNGNIVAVYQDDVSGSFVDDVRYRIFEPDGTPVGASALVAAGPGERIHPDVAALRDGGFVVVWGLQIVFTQSRQIMASIYDDAGNVVNDDIPVSAVQDFNGNPNVLGLADDGFLVTWTNGDANLVRAHQFDPTGNSIGSEFTAHNGGSLPLVGNPQAALLTSGRFAYAIDNQSGVNFDLDVFTGIWNPGREIADVDGVLWQHTDGRVETAHHDLPRVQGLWSIAGTGDFDGDGDGDVLWHHAEGAVLTWELEDGQHVANHALPTATGLWQIAGTGDFDGDGDDDIVWRHPEGGVVTWEL